LSGVSSSVATLAAAVVTPIGAVLARTDVTADARGYREPLHLVRQQVPGARCWALEGAGSYGAGLAADLDAEGERVVEVCRPKRLAQRAAARPTALTPCVQHAKRWPASN
jgi:transposase